MSEPSRSPRIDHRLSCLCGRLVARWIDGVIEHLRCKRTLRLELTTDGAIRVVE